jgi:hypothetical protein
MTAKAARLSTAVATRSATDSDLLSPTFATAATSGGTPAAAAPPFTLANAGVRRCWSIRGFPARSGDVAASSAGSNCAAIATGEARGGGGFQASKRFGVLWALLLLLTVGHGAGVRGDGGEGDGDLAVGACVNDDGSEGDWDLAARVGATGDVGEGDRDLAAGAGVSSDGGEGDGDGDLAAADPCDGVRTRPVARRSCGRARPAVAARPSRPPLSMGELSEGKCKGESCGLLAFAAPSSSLAEPYSSGGDASNDGVGVWYSWPGGDGDWSGRGVSSGWGTGGGGLSGAVVRGVDGMVADGGGSLDGRDQGGSCRVMCARLRVAVPDFVRASFLPSSALLWTSESSLFPLFFFSTSNHLNPSCLVAPHNPSHLSASVQEGKKPNST